MNYINKNKEKILKEFIRTTSKELQEQTITGKITPIEAINIVKKQEIKQHLSTDKIYQGKIK